MTPAGRGRDGGSGRHVGMTRAMTPPIPPREALTDLLPPDVDLRSGAGLREEQARAVWYGVVWSRLGRGDLAWAQWDGVSSPALGPWVAAERGRVLRELGMHEAAEALERPALLVADDPVDAAMLRVSLTADAVGSNDVDRARQRLRSAEMAVRAAPPGPRLARQRLRLTWVRVEVAFLSGEQPSEAGLPSWDEQTDAPRLPPDHAWGSRFHTAKGLLFAGVVRGDDRLLDAAAADAPPVLRWAIELARADRGRVGALEAARRAWATLVPPPGTEQAVAATPTARRLALGSFPLGEEGPSGSSRRHR
jgi:hypothetical protein